MCQMGWTVGNKSGVVKPFTRCLWNSSDSTYTGNTYSIPIINSSPALLLDGASGAERRF